METKIKAWWLGHSAFKLESTNEQVIYIDPFLSGNPSTPDDQKNPDDIDFILLTHGHEDHVGDTLDLAEKTGCKVVAPVELSRLLTKHGLSEDQAVEINKGGSVHFDGCDVTNRAPHRIARAGVGLVPEGRRCFAPLTVLENLEVAARPGPFHLDAVLALFPRLGERRGQVARTLSGGEQQMLAIGRALMTNPRLLILDEATEGLAPTIRAEIWSVIEQLKRAGQSILLVDKNLAELLRVADRCTIIERGAVVWSDRATALSHDITARRLGV